MIDFESLDFTLGWGPDWIRAGIGGHETIGPNTEACPHIDDCPETGNIAFLPDLKTEATKFVGLPPFIEAKANRGESSAVFMPNTTVRGYLITWLTDWVRDYGIDGFRIDTVRHVEADAWLELKHAAVDALRTWKANNPEKALDNLDFWMTGEYWLHQAQPIAPNGTIYNNFGFDNQRVQMISETLPHLFDLAVLERCEIGLAREEVYLYELQSYADADKLDYRLLQNAPQEPFYWMINRQLEFAKELKQLIDQEVSELYRSGKAQEILKKYFQ